MHWIADDKMESWISNLNYWIIDNMDVANENLLVIKKHNRKIVERAYQNSTVNANYQFPRRNIGQ